MSKSPGDHVGLVVAIESGNPTQAMEAVIDHIWAGFDLQIEALNAG